MPEVVFPGVRGRIKGLYSHGKSDGGPVAMVMHSHSGMQYNMKSMIPYNIYHLFQRFGFSVLSFDFREEAKSSGGANGSSSSSGVNNSTGAGELFDATSAFDYLQHLNPKSRECWVCGFSFGAWIAMQLLMRRPEIRSFISISPLVNIYDFSFLAPCPSSGLLIGGSEDKITPSEKIVKFGQDVKLQKDAKIDTKIINGANHFFNNEIESLVEAIEEYVSLNAFKKIESPPSARKRARVKSIAV